MSKNHSRTRSVGLILIGLMLGAVTIAPAFANHTPKHTAKQIKKLNKKIKKVNNTVKTLPTTSAVQQSIDSTLKDSLESFSAVIDTSGETKTLVTHGPLSLKAKCTFNGAIDLEVYFDSSAPNWWFSDNESGSGPLAANLNDPTQGFKLSNTPSSVAEYTNDIDDGSAAVQLGGKVYYLATDGESLGMGTNVFGHKCFVIGHAAKASYVG